MVIILLLIHGQFNIMMQDVVSATPFCTLLFYCLKLSMRNHALNVATVSDIKLHLSFLFLSCCIYIYVVVSHTLQYFLWFLFVCTNRKCRRNSFKHYYDGPIFTHKNNDNKVFLQFHYHFYSLFFFQKLV